MLDQPMTEGIPLTCRRCGAVTKKHIDWLQQNTFLTCEVCEGTTLIDKDICAGLLARRELRHQP